MIRLFALVILLIASLSVGRTPAIALSNAAKYLIDQERQEACDGRDGTLSPDGAIERDLDGDGREDFILSHHAFVCSGQMSRSLFCGAQVCTVKIYLRRGALLQLVEEYLSIDIEVGPGPVPIITGHGHGGGQSQIRWNGQAFESLR